MKEKTFQLIPKFTKVDETTMNNCMPVSSTLTVS